MARAKVTQQDVDQAADQLLAAGRPVTTITVRETLGRGSFSTIGTMLAVWRERQAAARAPKVELALPEGVQRSIAGHIEAEVGKVRQHAAEELQAEEAARALAEARVEELESAVESMTGDMERLQRENAEMNGRWKQLSEELNAERARAAETTKALEARAGAAEREAAVLAGKLEVLQQQPPKK